MNFKHLLAMTLVAGVALTGCSSTSTETPSTPTEEQVVVETPTPETSETEVAPFSGDAVSKTPVGDDSTDVIITTITYEDGKPVNVLIDVQTDSGSKREASVAGTYDMGGELAWHEQMDALQSYIVENNFDLSKVTLSDDDGHTDAITGVSIKIGSYLSLVEALMTSVEDGTYQAPVE